MTLEEDDAFSAQTVREALKQEPMANAILGNEAQTNI